MLEKLKKWWLKLPWRSEGLRVHGELKLIGRDKNGKALFVRRQKNLITNAGFDLICDVLGLNAQPSDITHMAIGSGAVGDATATTLTSEDQRDTTVYAHTGGTKTCTFTTTFTTVVAATEYGLFNATPAGTMLNTAGFTAITVDSLEIVTTITLS
jgi:hypothetical protein